MKKSRSKWNHGESQNLVDNRVEKHNDDLCEQANHDPLEKNNYDLFQNHCCCCHHDVLLLVRIFLLHHQIHYLEHHEVDDHHSDDSFSIIEELHSDHNEKTTDHYRYDLNQKDQKDQDELESGADKNNDNVMTKKDNNNKISMK